MSRTGGVLVSVIIDNYNYGRFLPAAIESAFAQTYTPCEVIIVDDGSTDDSAAVIARYGAARAIFKDNGGQASAFNTGFAASSGDVIVFLDADDVLEPDAARWAVEAFTASPNAVKVQYRMRVVDAAGEPTGAVVPPQHVRMPTGDLRRHLTRSNFSWWTPNSGQAWRASMLRRLFPLPEAVLRNTVDYYLQPTAAMLGEVVSIDRVGALYRRHGSNELLRDEVDLDNLRTHITRARDIHPYIRDVAVSVGLFSYPEEVSDLQDIVLLAVRMTSARLEPEAHPIPRDSVPRLARQGVVASLTRPDVVWTARVANALWFVVAALAPRSAVPNLAKTLFYPAARGRWEKVVRAITRASSRRGREPAGYER